MEDQNKYNGSRRNDDPRQDARRYADEGQYADPRYAQDGYAPQDSRTQQQYGGYARQYTADPRYTQQYPDPRYAAGQTGRIRMPREGYGSGQTGRIRVPREGYERDYAAGQTSRIRVPRDGYERDYAAGQTSRIRMPRDGYEQDDYAAAGRTERTRMPRERREEEYEEQLGTFARINETRPIRTRRYEDDEPIGEELYEEDLYEEELEDADQLFEGEEDEGERSAFARRLDAIRDAVMAIPMQKMVLFGGLIAVVLLAIILFAVLRPGKNEDGPASVAASPTPEWTATPTPTRAPTPTPAPTPHPCEVPLQQGMEADIVADIQQRLIDLGYMDYTEIDGVMQVTTTYGPKTKNAVRTFQMKNDLDADGWCGVGTFDLMMSDQAKAYFISRNDEGDMVLKMQNRLIQLGFLSAAPTGYCGESTVLAVQKFQQANGLDADGKAGQQTLAMLYSDDAVNVNGAKVPMAAETTPVPEATAIPDAAAPEATPAA